MELFKLSENVYYTSYEQERDRPRLGYIKGSHFSVAIDAGHSKDHLYEFYDLLKKEGLPLPAFTIITHWHWDHSFAMHAINGLSICNKRTNNHLKEFIASRSEENDRAFLNLNESIAKEYANNKPIIVTEADIEFENSLILNNGDQEIRVFECPSPHTDDATFIYLSKDKVLFVGDGISGTFPTWIADRTMAQKLADFIEPLDVSLTIGGHWENMTKKELIEFMFERT